MGAQRTAAVCLKGGEKNKKRKIKTITKRSFVKYSDTEREGKCMMAKDYQTPELLILMFENKDVMTASNWAEGKDEDHDKGVVDFFGQ